MLWIEGVTMRYLETDLRRSAGIVFACGALSTGYENATLITIAGSSENLLTEAGVMRNPHGEPISRRFQTLCTARGSVRMTTSWYHAVQAQPALPCQEFLRKTFERRR